MEPKKEIKAHAIGIAGDHESLARYGENVDVISTNTSAGVIVTPRACRVGARNYQKVPEDRIDISSQ